MDWIIGIILVLFVGLAETQCRKDQRITTFAFLVILSLAYSIGYSDWSYMLYPVGVVVSFFGWQWFNHKRNELKYKKENQPC